MEDPPLDLDDHDTCPHHTDHGYEYGCPQLPRKRLDDDVWWIDLPRSLSDECAAVCQHLEGKGDGAVAAVGLSCVAKVPEKLIRVLLGY